jgi:branched-chain amino acid aminotransferase
LAFAWLNGRLVDADLPHLRLDDRGLLLADGLFETMRAEAGVVPWLAAHLARLRTGADVLGLPVPPALDDPADLLAELLRANRLERAAVRLTLTRGPGPRGLAAPEPPMPTILVTVAPLPAAPPPARVAIAAGTCRNERSPLSRIKSLAYLDQILAWREARAGGADDALLLNTAGRLACATAATLFVVDGDRLLTPPLAEGALPGTTRARILALAATLGVEAAEEPLPPAILASCGEAFLANALVLLRPARSIAGLERDLRAPGPIGTTLAAALAQGE